MKILYFGSVGSPPSRKKKNRKSNRKKKKVKVARTLHRTFLMSLGRRRMDYNTLYGVLSTKGKLVWQGNLDSSPKRMDSRFQISPLIVDCGSWICNGFNGFTPCWVTVEIWHVRYGRCHIYISIYISRTYSRVMIYTQTYIPWILRGWLIHGTGILGGF